jgi:SAM-dependent MidA family methyltransferase
VPASNASVLVLHVLQSIDPLLPEPDASARAHSARVREAIANAIDAGGGYLPFERYMQIALYAPGLGYYVAGARKFGAGGDFVTAPGMTTLFGTTLGVQIAAILDANSDRQIVELGAGSGKLAADLLSMLAASGTPAARYQIIEVSAELRERQRATLEHLAPSELSRVEWLTEIPATIAGVVVMNEVLDAIPPHLIARRGGVWLERGVTRDGSQFAWIERPLEDERLATRAAGRFPADVDYLSEINPAAEALVELIGRRLASGAMLIIDYGFPRAEYYHRERSEGTLIGHYRHRAHTDPFLWPGLSDLTAHVDFTAIAEAGERAGLSVAGFASQASFLLSCGLLDRLREVGPTDSLAYLREASAVQTLTSPAEMGESFKVLALARGANVEWPGFALSDRSHRL